MAEPALQNSQEKYYSLAEFEASEAFEYLCSIENPYNQAMAERRISVNAKEVGFSNFKRLFYLYKQDQKKKDLKVISDNGVTNFADLSLELQTGEWTADELGVYRPQGNQMEVACSHPIIPVKRLRSIDTSMIKYELAFKRGGETKRSAWTPVVIDACDMASPTKIVDKLAPYGVSVTGGDRAKAMVDYLRDITDMNYDSIPEVKCISRMGWNEEGFAPYTSDAAFDGANAFAGAYKAIRECGVYEAWRSEALDARSYSLTARIVLAASFAAPLVEKLGISPFFVHLWSTSSGSGKTVGQMLGASVWADPSPGGPFFPTFRSTSVGFEMMAGFLHSIPLFIDELQLAKDKHGRVQFNVYELASGSGKLRSNKALGLNYTPRWATTFITSGETPIVSELDGEGALNRVFEIECVAEEQVIRDGHRTANNLKSNFGFAGKRFVEHLSQDGVIDHAKQLYDKFYVDCTRQDSTEKQAMAAAALLTADKLATDLLFQDGNELTVKEISEFCKSRAGVSLMQRGYDALCDWININAAKLRGVRDDDKGECYGIVEGVSKDHGGGTAYIIRSVFDGFCADNGINPKGFLSHLKSRNLIIAPDKRFTVLHYLGNYNRAQCVAVRLPDDSATGLHNSCISQSLHNMAGAYANYEIVSEEDDSLPF